MGLFDEDHGAGQNPPALGPQEASQRRAPDDMDAQPAACRGRSTAATEPRSSHADRSTPAAWMDPRTGGHDAQQLSSDARKRRSKESGGGEPKYDGDTLSEGTLGALGTGKRQRCRSDAADHEDAGRNGSERLSEGSRHGDSQGARPCARKRPVPTGTTRTVRPKHCRRTLPPDMRSGAAVSSANLDPGIPGVQRTRKPMAGAPCAARKRHASKDRHSLVGPRRAAKSLKPTAAHADRERGRLLQRMQPRATGGIVREASPREPLPRLQGRGWHDRWPPPALGERGRDATEAV